jgi:hypothetical protein
MQDRHEFPADIAGRADDKDSVHAGSILKPAEFSDDLVVASLGPLDERS